MNIHFRLGRAALLFVYVLEGSVSLFMAFFMEKMPTEFAIATLLFWVIGFLILLTMSVDTDWMKTVYLGTTLLINTGMAIWIAEVYENAYILILMFFLHWMSNLLLARKDICRVMLVVQTIVLLGFTFVGHRFKVSECVSILIVLCCGYFFVNRMVELMYRHEMQSMDHMQSLDDMLELVEAKFEEARQANEAKSSFLANMSHEIRTPINAVLGLDTMILRESKNESVRQYALNIHTAGQTLLSIINDILDFSKIESGKLDLIPVEYDLASLVNDVVNMIKPKVEEKGLSFVIKLDETLPSKLIGDDVRIRQVLVNLLTNAVKYTHEGSVTLTVNGTVEGDSVRLFFSVKDTGIGIAKEDQKKLFEKFVRIEEKRNRNIEGTGLGINIVTTLLHLMGSRLEVDSVYGEGSEFYFYLQQPVSCKEPIGDLERRIREQSVNYSHDAVYRIPSVRLLVVDDNAMNRLVFKELLRELECEIDEAESGIQCLEFVQEHKYDIIFMDHMMPEMDGIETLEKMKQFGDYPNQDTPVIILTANAIAGAREEYLEIGFDDYLSKPINPDKLEKMISEFIPEEKKEIQQSTEEAFSKPEEPSETITLPDLEGVDWDYALLKLKSVEVIQKVVKDFSMVAASDCKELQQLYGSLQSAEDSRKSQAFQSYRVKVHSMKSSAAMIGAISVSSLAKVLEYAARDEDMDVINRVMPVFVRDWDALKVHIQEEFGYGAKPSTDKVIESQMLRQFLTMLTTAMENFDTDMADSIIEELQKYSYEGADAERMEKLTSAVMNLDVDQVAEITGQWINTPEK